MKEDLEKLIIFAVLFFCVALFYFVGKFIFIKTHKKCPKCGAEMVRKDKIEYGDRAKIGAKTLRGNATTRTIAMHCTKCDYEAISRYSSTTVTP